MNMMTFSKLQQKAAEARVGHKELSRGVDKDLLSRMFPGNFPWVLGQQSVPS